MIAVKTMRDWIFGILLALCLPYMVTFATKQIYNLFYPKLAEKQTIVAESTSAKVNYLLERAHRELTALTYANVIVGIGMVLMGFLLVKSLMYLRIGLMVGGLLCLALSCVSFQQRSKLNVYLQNFDAMPAPMELPDTFNDND